MLPAQEADRRLRSNGARCEPNWPSAANQVITADLNGDGLPDIVASCDGAWANSKQVSKSEIRWWRNEGR